MPATIIKCTKFLSFGIQCSLGFVYHCLLWGFLCGAVVSSLVEEVGFGFLAVEALGFVIILISWSEFLFCGPVTQRALLFACMRLQK